MNVKILRYLCVLSIIFFATKSRITIDANQLTTEEKNYIDNVIIKFITAETIKDLNELEISCSKELYQDVKEMLSKCSITFSEFDFKKIVKYLDPEFISCSYLAVYTKTYRNKNITKHKGTLLFHLERKVNILLLT